MKTLLLILFAAAGSMAADATGKWSGSLIRTSGEGQEQTGPALLELKQEGTTLTGTAGPTADERHNIQNGKVEDGNITFEVPTNETTMKFALKQEGDSIKGSVTRDRDGRVQTAKLDLKREK
ncbi:MAG TPA: hypothetical protein VEX68_24785 [Bryobacteraceae bacterium]|nr:hypothetical protein [Bryobacteraceae bacterium]